MFPATAHVFRNGFLPSTALSMFDLMGWAFFALLCDYKLGILLIKAQFYILKSPQFWTEATMENI